MSDLKTLALDAAKGAQARDRDAARERRAAGDEKAIDRLRADLEKITGEAWAAPFEITARFSDQRGGIGRRLLTDGMGFLYTDFGGTQAVNDCPHCGKPRGFSFYASSGPHGLESLGKALAGDGYSPHKCLEQETLRAAQALASAARDAGITPAEIADRALGRISFDGRVR